MKTNWLRALAIVLVPLCFASIHAAPLVPGTGVHVEKVGDDFEDPEWDYVHNLPKSTKEHDERTNGPGGASKNGRWYEGIKRGQPDYIKRVATPPGGLPGSEGALMLRSLQTGVPGRPSFRQQQDDFIANVDMRLGGSIPVSQNPSVVARVFFPPIEQWEQRAGCTFTFRAALNTHAYKENENGRGSSYQSEIYYPGFFVEFRPKEQSKLEYDTAFFRIRASRGGDFQGPQITTTGWWTLGLSVTPDGQVHYYARQGIEDLTAEDYITSQFPYGYRAESFRTFFFNVCTGDDNRTWSTPWVIDDPKVYFVPRR